MRKRPTDERLAELEEKARKLRIETAVEKSPAIQQVRKAQRCLAKAIEVATDETPGFTTIEDAHTSLLNYIDLLGEPEPKS